MVNSVKLPKEHRYRKWAVELAGIIGFKSRNIKFPIVDENGFDLESIIYDELSLDKLFEIVGGFATQSEGEFLPILERGVADKREVKGLESLFEVGLFIEDIDGDFLPEKINLKISLSDSPSDMETISACNMAARFGLDCLGYNFPFVSDDDSVRSLLIKECEGQTLLELVDGNLILQGEKIDELSSLICNEFPHVSKNRTIKDLISDLDNAFSLNSVDGMKLCLSNLEEGTAVVAACSEGYEELEADFDKFEFKSVRDLKESYKQVYELEWEGDRAFDVIKSKVVPFVKVLKNVDDSLTLFYSLSEDENARGVLSSKIDSLFKDENLDIKIDSVCSYKQGFSWIVEHVVPKITKEAESVRIGFRSFLPEGETVWKDESGVTPKITSNDVDTPDRWFDLPVRLLQEIYPIDDVISSMTGIEREKVEFVVCDGDYDYVVEAIADGEVLFKDCYKGAFSERSYMSEFPGIGKVHPSTGYVRVFDGDKMIFEELISTDLEELWAIYQDEILPYCKDVVLNKSNGKPCQSMQPFFAQMKLEVWASEPDFRLPCREDLFSSLDAFHEDIYFVGLDFFKTLGIRTSGENLDAPGLILPVIKKRDGAPKMVFTLFEEEIAVPVVSSSKGDLVACPSSHIGTTITKIVLEDDGIGIEIDCKNTIFDAIKPLANLLPTGKLRISDDVNLIKWISCDKIVAGMPTPKICDYVDIKDVDIMEDKIIGYDEYMTIINELKRVKELRVYKVATSYQGRDIYAIELISNLAGYVSRVKSIDRCVSEMVIGRHHANEVSGTNSNLMLIREILTNDEYDFARENLNLVFIPIENPDGAAIHYELQKDNPNWKLHVARFNSLGMEMASGYFDDNTIHTECFAFTNTWRKWLPDVVTDNHGVPSHEWDQQFSGYTSPWFKGFWMPRALLYSYFFHIEDERYNVNMAVNKAMEDVVAESMAADKEIRNWNLEWQDRFKKYANDWMPKLFPAEYYKELISYFIPSDYVSNHKYSSVRYPWITTVSFISEISDETAQGEYLRLCGKTHMTHDLAVLKLLNESELKRVSYRDGDYVSSKRLRPIVCPNWA